MTTSIPSPNVLRAFGANDSPVLLTGGQGETWRAGDVVLKPCRQPEEAVWVAEVLAALGESVDFRVARPRRSASGDWIAYGFQAWQAVPGEPDPGRCDDVIRAGAAFHRALADLPRPSFLDRRDDPWTYGERVAWGELPLTGDEPMGDLLASLAGARRPVDLPSQIVHGDLLGNVLFAAGLAPAIIDWPVYFRPAPWAHAVAAIDAVTWYSGDPALLRRHRTQMLVRALMYRIATSEGCRRFGRPVRESAEHYRPVVARVLAPPIR